MICKKFTAWLDEGNSCNSIAALPAEFAHHVAGCSQCQKSLSQQEAVLKRLADSTILPGDTRQRILSRLEKRIETSRPAPASFFASLIGKIVMVSSHKLVFAGVILALVVTASVFFNLSGSKEYEIRAVSSKNQQLAAGDRLICSAEKTKISWNSQDQIEIDGQAEFIVGKNRLKMLNGTARLVFSQSARGYEIEMQECLLTVVGTVVKLEMMGKKDHIFVERGRVKWQHQRLASNGLLSAGQSLSISADHVDYAAPVPVIKAEPASSPESSTELTPTAEPVLPE